MGGLGFALVQDDPLGFYQPQNSVWFMFHLSHEQGPPPKHLSIFPDFWANIPKIPVYYTRFAGLHAAGEYFCRDSPFLALYSPYFSIKRARAHSNRSSFWNFQLIFLVESVANCHFRFRPIFGQFFAKISTIKRPPPTSTPGTPCRSRTSPWVTGRRWQDMPLMNDGFHRGFLTWLTMIDGG